MSLFFSLPVEAIEAAGMNRLCGRNRFPKQKTDRTFDANSTRLFHGQNETSAQHSQVKRQTLKKSKRFFTTYPIFYYLCECARAHRSLSIVMWHYHSHGSFGWQTNCSQSYLIEWKFYFVCDQQKKSLCCGRHSYTVIQHRWREIAAACRHMIFRFGRHRRNGESRRRNNEIKVNQPNNKNTFFLFQICRRCRRRGKARAERKNVDCFGVRASLSHVWMRNARAHSRWNRDRS